MLYGPFAAQYPGNSVGGVLKITTRMPEKLEITAKETIAFQDFSLYGTSKLFWTNETAVTVGDKINDFSWFVAGNWLHGFTQPLTYIPAGHGLASHMDFQSRARPRSSTAIRAATGRKRNSARPRTRSARPAISPTTKSPASSSSPMTSRRPSEPPIRSASGRTTAPRRPRTIWSSGYGPYFGPAYTPRDDAPYSTRFSPALTTSILQSFGAGYYRVQEKQLINSFDVKSNTRGLWDFEVSASNFDYLQSDQVSPLQRRRARRRLHAERQERGLHRHLLDAPRPQGDLPALRLDGPHEASFGLHGDQFHLNNPTWLTWNWTAGTAASTGVAASIGDGTTQTKARMVPGRLEDEQPV